MLKTKDILDEKDKKLRQISKEVVFPLTEEDQTAIKLMSQYLKNSQVEKLAEKYNLRPGMGLAACQVGINKRYFVIVHEEEENVFKKYIVVNPKIISYSEELIYASGGEGCLSVNRPVEGIVPRHARVTIKAFNEQGETIEIRAREELAIAFQHEIDHLNGILFVDKINKNDPFKDSDTIRAI
jgi:peptide deformylase